MTPRPIAKRGQAAVYSSSYSQHEEDRVLCCRFCIGRYVAWNIANENAPRARGWDVYHLEQEWRLWLGENEIIPKQPEKHFVKFCATWFEKRGRP